MRRARILASILLVAVSPAAPGDMATLDGANGLALDADGDLLVSCTGSNAVIKMSRSGEKLLEFGADRLANPGGLCVDVSGRVFVANTGKNEIAAFDAEGKFLFALDGLAAPRDAALGNGLLYVADTGNSRVAVFDLATGTALDPISTLPDEMGTLSGPTGVAIAGSTLAIADAGNRRVVLLPTARHAVRGGGPVVIDLDGAEPQAVALGPGVYVVCNKEVRGYTRFGTLFGRFGAKAIRVTISYLFEPAGLAVDAHSSVLAVDKYSARVFVTNAQLLDPVPLVKLVPGDATKVAIEWTTPSPQPTIVDYGQTDDYGQRAEDAALTTKHRVVLEGLSPATRYFYRIHKPFEMIPESSLPKPGFSLRHQIKYHQRLFEGNVSRNNTFATLPKPGETDWAALPVIVLVYKNVAFPPAKDGTPPPNRVLDAADVALLKSELEKYRVFVWRHSHCKLNLEFTYVIVDEERNHDELGDITQRVFADVKAGITAQGKDLHDFWDVLVVGTHGWYANYLAGTVAGTDYELGSCYTAFGHGQAPGWWWFPTHEHGHLVHSIVMNSEIDTFAYPDAPWTLPGQFGEDFSFLAYNYRVQPERIWMTLRTTRINTSADANHNGVPDDDPRVPLDEKRFGWTAKMGGNCLTRLMAGVRTPGHPEGSDTDFQGTVHRLDEGELHWIDRRLPKGAITLDGKLGPGEWRELYSMPNLTTPPDRRDLKAKLYVAWDDGHYYFAVKSNKKVALSVDLDAANDGWFHGRDNLRFSVEPGKDDQPATADGAIWDFLDNTLHADTGLWYRGAYAPGDILAASGEQDGWYVIECAVPARPDVRIAPRRGGKFALRANLRGVSPDDGVLPTDFLDGESFVYDLTCSAH
jgi:hypothetical protein